MYRFSHYLGLAGFIVIALSTDVFCQGNSVGINTATPNPNAVLQLVSPDNNQGLLIPRLTTPQRLAMQLQASEKGLLVFDDTEGLFYYWNGSAWDKLLVSQNLQTLSLTGSLLKVSGANEVDLAGIDTDKQNLTFEGTNLSIERGNTVDLSSLITTSDADPENELQSLEFSSGVLTLTNDPNLAQVDLSNYDTDVTDDFDGDYASLANLPTLFSGDFGDLSNVPADLADGDDVDDADADATNEIQDISTDGTAGDISLSSGSSLTLNVDDADADASNELQTLSLAGSNLTLSNSGGTVSINDADFSITNEIQDISTDATPGNITLSSGSTLALNVNDADADNTNEIQDISTDGTAGDISLSSGSSLTLNVDDADADASNELQTLSLAGSNLTLSNSGGTVSINDADFSITNEIQDISTDASPGNITLSSGSTLALNVDDADADPTNEIQDISTDATSGNITLSSGSTLALNVDDADADPTNEIQDISTDATAGNITLSSGSTLVLNVDDADANPTNEIQDLNLTANTLTITNNGSATNIDLGPYQQDISISGNTVSISGGTGFNLTATSPNPMDVLKWNGSNWDTGTDNVNDADSNPTNELQTLTLVGTDLTIQGKNTIDLSPLGVLPDQSGFGVGDYLTTNGTGASWSPLVVGSAEITNGTISAIDINASVAGNGLSGGAGTPLAVNLSGTSGLQITSDQLEMQNVITAGTYSTLITAQVQVDAKGRVLSFSASDVRLKKEISKISGVLDRLVEVNGYTYHYIDQQDSVLHHGLIAQELQELFPDLAVMGANGYYSVNYQGLIPILIEALKEEHARVSGLQEEIDEMKAQLSSNDERFKTLEAKLDLLIQSTTTAKAPASSQE
tara:strand:+ start:24972 stop:27563 length:2592 start_codon:yes stop_codon:yes gene_type:complete